MFVNTQNELIGWTDRAAAAVAPKAWKPVALRHDQWPPDYDSVYAWRIKVLSHLRANPDDLQDLKRYYADHPEDFILDWMDTYDPRRDPNASDPEKRGAKWMPFVFFARQSDFIEFLHELRRDQESGLTEKARDMGATWLSCAYSVWSWLFIPSDAIGWGSRKQELVDRLGDPDSIFEKLRLLINRLPDVFLPAGLEPKKHLTFMKCLNPENGATISGESGDNIGRGGRKSMYFVDEAAHLERPDKIEAALGDNTRVRVDISSVNGLGNPFHRRRQAGVDWRRGVPIDPGFIRVFVMDWRDHPEKTQEWYDRRKARYEREGLLHLFAQEVDRNYSAAISNAIIQMEWVQAAIDAHLKVKYLRCNPSDVPNVWTGGLDVADGGIDRNAMALRQWIILRAVDEWGERDVGVTTRRAIDMARQHRGIAIQYDAVGMGAGVKAEYNRLAIDEKLIDLTQCKMVAWNAGAGVLYPYDRIIPNDEQSLCNQDFFGNLKAQAWWSIRTRFYKTYKAVTEGAIYAADELISLDSTMPLLSKLCEEFCQPVKGTSGQLKTIIDKMPDGMKSPNLADAAVMAFFPVPDDFGMVLVGNYG